MRLRPDWYDGTELEYRFDLYGALHMLCSRWHSGQWSRGYRILSRLYLAGYRPGLSSGRCFESDQQKWIYRDLYRNYRKGL
jgi:hypothetical protein